MTKYLIGADKAGSKTRPCLDKIIETVRNAGNEVQDIGITPNLEKFLGQGGPQDIGVFVVNGICLGTMLSCQQNVTARGKCKEIFFCIPQEIYTGSLIKSADDINNPDKKLKIVQDGTNWPSSYYQYEGKYTTQEICDKLDGINYAYGTSCEEAAQQILAGGGASSGGTGLETEGSSSGGMAIKDSTFEQCIKRTCAATDSVFIVENNAAVLFPYTDWMALTLQKDMETIGKDNIDPDIFEIEYNTTGTYNKVTATWGKSGGGNQNTKTNSKTKGKFTTKEKNNPDGSVEISKQYDSLVEQFGELEKKVDLQVTDRNTVEFIVNALLIQYIREFNSAYKVRSLNKTKYVGGTFYAIENLHTNKTDVLYLNGYTIRTQKNEPLYIDLEFKYGPSGVEDINDYQEYSGVGGNSGTNDASGTSVTETDLIGIGKELAKYKYGGPSTYEEMKKQGRGDCYAMSDALFTELSAKGYAVKIVQYASHYSKSGTHRTVMYKDTNGEWQDFPYKQCGFDTMFIAMNRSSEKIIKST